MTINPTPTQPETLEPPEVIHVTFCSKCGQTGLHNTRCSKCGNKLGFENEIAYLRQLEQLSPELVERVANYLEGNRHDNPLVLAHALRRAAVTAPRGDMLNTLKLIATTLHEQIHNYRPIGDCLAFPCNKANAAIHAAGTTDNSQTGHQVSDQRVKLLLRYTDHLSGCTSYTNGPCTCGFESAMQELADRGTAATSSPHSAERESPILAFEKWLTRYVTDCGKLSQTEYSIAYAAFIAAHLGEGPLARTMNDLAPTERTRVEGEQESLLIEGNREEAIRLLRKLRETNDPEEIQRQKESWAQLEAALNPKPVDSARLAAEEIADYVSDGILGMGNEVTKTDRAKFLEIVSNHFSRAAALADNDAESLLQHVAYSGVEFDDNRMGYVVVQIDRDVWEQIQKLVRPTTKGDR